MGRNGEHKTGERASEPGQYTRTGRVRRFGVVILLAALCTALMLLGQVVGQWLRDRPDLARWAILALAAVVALGWERVTRRGR